MKPRFELINVDEIGEQVRGQLSMFTRPPAKPLSAQVGKLVHSAQTPLHSTADEMVVIREYPNGMREIIIEKNVVFYGKQGFTSK